MQSDASSAEPRKRRIGGGPLVAVVLILLLVVYVLCSGPLFWLAVNRFIPLGLFDLYFAPLAWLELQNDACSGALEGYLSWWAGNR